MSNTTTQEMRQAFYTELHLTPDQISVVSEHGSFRVSIKCPKVDFNAVKEIAERWERIDYDDYSGEILQGANTFVFVSEYQVMETVEMMIKPTPTRVVMFGSTPSGWYEKYHKTVEKAQAYAAKHGWTIVPCDKIYL